MAVLPSTIYSADHLRFCIEDLGRYVAALERRDRGSKAALPELSIEASALLAEIKGADSDRVDVIQALVAELKTHLQAAPQVSITLAAPAPHRLKLELISWLRANIMQEVMVDFLVNPEIAGGMVLRTANKVFDFSFRTKLLGNAPRFTEVLEHVR